MPIDFQASTFMVSAAPTLKPLDFLLGILISYTAQNQYSLAKISFSRRVKQMSFKTKELVLSKYLFDKYEYLSATDVLFKI